MQLIALALAALLVSAPALAQAPAPALEDRLDACRFERGGLEQEAARLTFELRAERKKAQALAEELAKLKTNKPAPEPK